MIFGVLAGAITLVAPVLLVLLDRREELRRPATVVLGVFGGALAGAGLLIGGFHQSTTAYIDSGYSFASVLEWVLLFACGATVGGVMGGALGWHAPRHRVLVAVLLVLAGAGAAGWVLDSARPTIDCEDRRSFCEDRYD